MPELICNLHIHSKYSDGSGNYSEILQSAASVGLDVVIVTDHNILVKNVERYRITGDHKTLLLTGEEVHNQDRHPQKSHTLVIGCDREMADHSSDPQILIDKVNLDNGMTFLAHPYEYDLPAVGEDDISWADWEVRGFTGLELWNGFSELKSVARNMTSLVRYAFFPQLIPHGPLPQTLAKWDELLAAGNKVVAVAGSDAHALDYRAGPIRKTIFPYAYHFSTINNHLLVNRELTGDIDADKSMIYQALSSGASFIGFDLAAPTRGFSFTAENETDMVSLGDTLTLERGATLRAQLPHHANLRVIHNNRVTLNLPHADRLVQTITEPGYYRIEAYINYKGVKRGWIFSNPIYIHRKMKTGLI